MALRLDDNNDGTYTVAYEWRVFRFLFDDGRTVDVKGIIDDSTMREAVRMKFNAKAISGIAYINEPVEAPKKVPAKKVGRVRAEA